METESGDSRALEALEKCIDSLSHVTIQKPICHRIQLRSADLEVVISPGSRRINYHWAVRPELPHKEAFFDILESSAEDFLGNGYGALKANVETDRIPEIGPFHYCTTILDIHVEESLARLLFNVFPTTVDVRFMEYIENHKEKAV